MIPALVKTARLRLRPPSLDDAPDIFARYATDRQVTRYLTWRRHSWLPDTHDFLLRTIAAMEAGTEVQWVIERQDLEGPLGMIGFRFTGHGAELGYVLERASWGLGYATEAAQALADWALDEPHLSRVWAVCDVEHRASARVLEKVGMEREGLLRRWVVLPNRSAEPRDCWCYARVK